MQQQYLAHPVCKNHLSIPHRNVRSAGGRATLKIGAGMSIRLATKPLWKKGRNNNREVFVAEDLNDASKTLGEEMVFLTVQDSNFSRWFEINEALIEKATLLLWYGDSEASSHTIPYPSAYLKLQATSPFSVQMGDKLVVSVEGRGIVKRWISFFGTP